MGPPPLRRRRVHAFPPPLLLLLLWPPVTPGALCPSPVSVEHADIHVKSYHVSSRERYVCNSGFKRKAGTSSLIECVLNEATNTAQWTAPSLKCIRDPALTHQRPEPPSIVVTTKVTPRPERPSPTGREATTLPPKSDPTVAMDTAIVPGSRLPPPPPPPSPGTTGPGREEPSPAPPQPTAGAPHPLATSHGTPGVHARGHAKATVAISTSVAVACGAGVLLLLVWCIRSRQTSRPPAPEMEPMEVMPLAAGTGHREGVGASPRDL
ncbi:interleukin-15 receptor subunit alpha [Perognathus longimembris pacificus]|uniref:interleukin-15 receptor subunit alpha n=1 Tax=Perognathus longimembris pacificus TaxID=214514 RepID=UPI0020184B2B|nr:interleukin-15 receptor subunit alpha [Perognathus longimembris pacificus]